MTCGTRVDAYISIGSNVPWNGRCCEQIVLDAIAALDRRDDVDVVRRSRLYRTPAVTSTGVSGVAPYVNAAAHLLVMCSARALLDLLLGMELDCGRDRSREERWGPRTLDLDLLVFASEHIHEPGLAVPHPRLATRTFVLEPLADIAPDLVPPGLSEPIATMLDRLARWGTQSEPNDRIHCV